MTTSPNAIHLRMVIPPAPWTRAMVDGSVRVDGLTWECAADLHSAPDRFVATEGGGVDVGENGVRRYVVDLLAGAPPSAIPAFFTREHMQRNVIVRNDGSLTHAKQLEGRVVGSRLPVWSGTGAAVLMMLEAAYGVDLGRVRYAMGGPEPLATNPMGLDVRPGPSSDEEGFRMLLRGDLDAVIVTTGPRYFSMFGGDEVDEALKAFPDLKPLIDDPATMADAYRRTGLYPITDLVVAGGAVAGQPGLASRVLDALSEANRRAPSYRDVAEEALARREVELLGEDPYAYVLGESQRRGIDAFLDILHRMGAIEAMPPAATLFLKV